LIEEFLPEATPTLATLVARRVEPIADWLSLDIKNWQPYKIELVVSPQRHLQQDSAWLSSSLVAMAEVSGRWLLEKHCPPGELHIRVRQVELESSATELNHCTVRCEFEADEFELKLAELLRNRQVELFLPVMIYSAQDVLLSQVNFHFEIQWAPLLK
jgi:hypothetical protein